GLGRICPDGVRIDAQVAQHIVGCSCKGAAVAPAGSAGGQGIGDVAIGAGEGVGGHLSSFPVSCPAAGGGTFAAGSEAAGCFDPLYEGFNGDLPDFQQRKCTGQDEAAMNGALLMALRAASTASPGERSRPTAGDLRTVTGVQRN